MIRRLLLAAACGVRCACLRAGQLDRRRLDDLDAGFRPVRPHPAAVQGAHRDRRQGGGAGHRAGARCRAARRCRRRLRPCPVGGGEVRGRALRGEAPSGDVQRLRPGRAAQRSGPASARPGTSSRRCTSSRTRSAVHLARRPLGHARRRAQAVEGGRHRHQRDRAQRHDLDVDAGARLEQRQDRWPNRPESWVEVVEATRWSFPAPARHGERDARARRRGRSATADDHTSNSPAMNLRASVGGGAGKSAGCGGGFDDPATMQQTDLARQPSRLAEIWWTSPP